MTQFVKSEVGQKRVRAYVDGHVVADSRAPMLVWEHKYYPAYYLPADDVRAELVPTGVDDGAEVCDVKVAGRTITGGARRFTGGRLDGLVKLDWAAMDQWFEEDEPVTVHPRDPHKRVDILASSRHVVVRIGDTVVAESRQPRVLFETGLPPRYYLPLTDVRMDLLRPSDHHTQCPYKGTASYWHVEVDGELHENVLWTYPAPLPESQKVAGLACFYDERVDVTLDGVAQERPTTPFS